MADNATPPTTTSDDSLQDVNVGTFTTTDNTKEETNKTTTTADSDVDNLLQELDTPKQNDDDDELPDFSGAVAPMAEEPNDPLEHLKSSTAKLASSIALISSDIDTKLGISTKAKEIDETVQISQTTSKIGGWFSGINQQYGITSTATGFFSGVGATVAPLAKGLTDNVKEMDEKLGVSRGVAGGVAAGADFLNNAIAPQGNVSNDGISQVQEGDNFLKEEVGGGVDKESDFPDSFQK